MNNIVHFKLSLLLLSLQCFAAHEGPWPSSPPIPTPQQLAYQDLEIGAMISFAMYTFAPNASINYVPDVNVYSPNDLDTDSWLQAAQYFNATYAVFTSKHDVGFCAWPTEYPGYNYSVKHTSWGNGQRDVVAEFIASCKKYNIKPAIYYSIATNFYMGVVNGKVVNNNTQQQKEYNQMVLFHLKELWGNYGELAELWFDGGVLPPSKGGPDVVPLIEQYQPNAMVFNSPAGYQQCVRWVGDEGGVAPDPNWSTCATDTECYYGGSGSSTGASFCPAECDTPLRGYGSHQWFWLPDGELYVKTVSQLIDEYERSVGRNCNFMLNINPNPQGTVDKIDVERYQQFGYILNNEYDDSNAIAEASGTSVEIGFAMPGGTAYINRIILEEDQSKGELIQLFAITAMLENGEWVTLVGNGTSVGHKRICRFDPISVVEVKFVALQSTLIPTLKRMAAYYVGPSK